MATSGVWEKTSLWLAQCLKDLTLWSLMSGLLLVSVFIPLALACLRWFRIWWMLRGFPGPVGPLSFAWRMYRFRRSHPGLDFNVGTLKLFDDLSNEYLEEKLYRVYLGLKPHVLVYAADGVQAVLSQTKDLDKASVYKLLKNWMGNGLITSSGHAWKPRRRLITPAFHFRIMEDALDPINTAARSLTDKLSQLSNQEGLVNDLVLQVQHCTLRVICEAAMGVDIETLPESGRYEKAVVDECFMERFLRPWLWNPAIYLCTSGGRREWRSTATIREFSLQAIEARKTSLLEERSKGKIGSELTAPANKGRQCFMDVLLDMHLRSDENGNPENNLSLQDVREEVDTFMFAGHDTTTAGISFCLYLLGHSPEVQQKVYDELVSVFQGSDRPVTLEDIKELRYLDCVIKESMRIYPPVPMIGRSLKQELNIGGRVVPAGCNVMLFLLALNKDPIMFPEPEKFNPERFLPENAKSLHPYAFVPFSAGQRNCIGQRLAQIEMKAMLATVLRQCRVISLDPRDELQLAMEVVLRPKTPLRLRFESRK
ncbi:cytochrome P450 4V2-like isoform X2 [Ornithodoros turicata]|uniref:cytochrome P450 4V2-like isoform X2 n=1 Tax=Ornithodoros turicata TaxID=34597 RepID=UPI003139C165